MSDFDDLDELFDDLEPEPSTTLPNLELVGSFGSGASHRQEPAKFTDVALMAMFRKTSCLNCGHTTYTSLGYALKRQHHCRNQVIEYQFVMASAAPLYIGLPKFIKHYPDESPFCYFCCAAQGFQNHEPE